MKESPLAELKRGYAKFQERYKLPKFEQLNREFKIEKIQEYQTEFLLREIRLAISERITAFLHFLELFLNPTVAPVFILAALKELGASDKELIERLYKELVAIELNSVILDLSYDEKKEAAFIKETAQKWQALKPELQAFSELLLRLSPAKERKKSYVG